MEAVTTSRDKSHDIHIIRFLWEFTQCRFSGLSHTKCSICHIPWLYMTAVVVRGVYIWHSQVFIRSSVHADTRYVFLIKNVRKIKSRPIGKVNTATMGSGRTCIFIVPIYNHPLGLVVVTICIHVSLVKRWWLRRRIYYIYIYIYID